MRYWLDTEFIEDGKIIDLISIGIVAEDGREFYRLNWDCDHSKANDWVKENVLSLLPLKHAGNLASGFADDLSLHYVPRSMIVDDLLDFCNSSKYGLPEFWADFAAYDWVVFCQMFGTMMDLPKRYPMYINDIRQEWRRLGEPELPEQVAGHHNALGDARHCRELWKFLVNSCTSPV